MNTTDTLPIDNGGRKSPLLVRPGNSLISNQIVASKRGRDHFGVLIFFLGSLGLFFWPTGFETLVPDAAQQFKARGVAVENSSVHQVGMIRTGDQQVSVEILGGPHSGQIMSIDNPLLGRMGWDTFYKVDDTAFVVLILNQTGNVIHASTQGTYRIGMK